MHPLDRFDRRHIGVSDRAREHMLATVAADSVEALLAEAVPTAIAMREVLNSSIPAAASEREALEELRALAGQNTVKTAMIGLGYSGTLTPSVIKRNVLENPSWYTAYTPYQPEISQGRLEALINFQTMVTDLTGLDIANASMLDESTAVAEAMLLARRASKQPSDRFVADSALLPQTLAVLVARAAPLGIDIEVQDLARLATSSDAEIHDALGEHFGLAVQYPGANGAVWNPSGVIAASKASGAEVIVAADLLALTLLTPPAEFGADIAVGSTQRFGVPMGFGGPHAGYLSVRAGLERQMPGRLVGVSQDASGQAAYRLSLQAREQHIRREKATSNICTAQVLLAVMASMYAVYHGPEGLRHIARSTAAKARALADALTGHGLTLAHSAYFDTIRVHVPGLARTVVERADELGYLLWEVDEATVQVAVDETTTARDLALVATAFGLGDVHELHWDESRSALPLELARQSDFLTHPVFTSHHSETAMMRYLKSLADRDYALDRGMIPLGSCTMKLNAATEMEAVSWPEFANLHPFAPERHVRGSLAMIAELESWLAEVTG
ncbi:MAG: glycine dehydrogenase (aminomethyl-transferring), partial [Agromyces sp.]